MPNTTATTNARREFENLAKEHEPTLLRVARRMCGNSELAEDLVQDALVSGYRAYLDGRFDGSYPVAWMIKILTNAFRTFKRDNRVEANVDVEAIVEGQSEAPPWACKVGSPDQGLLEVTLAEPLEKALSRLSEEQRLCVVLIDIEQMSYAEVAESLQIPIGTVRSRLNRARLEMYSYLTEMGGMQ